ncbi:MAG: DUF433 domain-containing protein [Gemmataceae bacterium]
MSHLDRITINPEHMNGQPCIRGLRITVKRLLEVLSVHPDHNELRREYPEIEEEDIKQALFYASRDTDDRILLLGGSGS